MTSPIERAREVARTSANDARHKNPFACPDVDAAIAAYEAALAAEGMVLVPKKPTEEMIDGGQNIAIKAFEDRLLVGYIWREMIAAASQGEGT